MTFKDSMKKIIERLVEFIIKMESVKGLVFIAATLLCALGRITEWAWLVACMIVIGDRTLEKKLLIQKGMEELKTGISGSQGGGG